MKLHENEKLKLNSYLRDSYEGLPFLYTPKGQTYKVAAIMLKLLDLSDDTFLIRHLSDTMGGACITLRGDHLITPIRIDEITYTIK